MLIRINFDLKEKINNKPIGYYTGPNTSFHLKDYKPTYQINEYFDIDDDMNVKKLLFTGNEPNLDLMTKLAGPNAKMSWIIYHGADKDFVVKTDKGDIHPLMLERIIVKKSVESGVGLLQVVESFIDNPPLDSFVDGDTSNTRIQKLADIFLDIIRTILDGNYGENIDELNIKDDAKEIEYAIMSSHIKGAFTMLDF